MQVAVQPGPEGKRQFLDRIKAIFGLEDDESIALTFGCKVPGTGEPARGAIFCCIQRRV